MYKLSGYLLPEFKDFIEVKLFRDTGHDGAAFFSSSGDHLNVDELFLFVVEIKGVEVVVVHEMLNYKNQI